MRIVKLKNCFYNILIYALVTVLIYSFSQISLSAENNTHMDSNNNVGVNDYNSVSYFNQYDNIKKLAKLDKSAEVSGLNYVKASAKSPEIINRNGRKGVLLNEMNRWCEWEITVSETGTASLELLYSSIAEENNDILISVIIDGKYQFSEASSCTLSRIWKPDMVSDGSERPFEKDSSGNEIRTNQLQSEEWTTEVLQDELGIYDEPYLFFLEKGKHTVRLEAVESSVIIASLCFNNKKCISYDEYLSQHAKASSETQETAYLQAELFLSSNNSSIYPTYDKNDVATVPNNPKTISMNMIGGSNWATSDDIISWRVNIKEPGMYRIAFRARQNINSGLISYRDLYVNGEIPFEEAKNIPFGYGQNWQIYTFGVEKEYMLYLEPGDILTLRATTGPTSEIIRSLQGTLSSLNVMYRSIIAITSADPDIYQDYKLESKLPTLGDELAEAHALLSDIYNKIMGQSNLNGSLASSLKIVNDSIKEFSEKTYLIPENLSSMTNNLASLGSILSSLTQQPLEIDYIAFVPQGCEMPKANGGIFSSLRFSVMQLIYSFITDYSSIGSTSEKSINVWASTGRDQAQIIERLISSDFTKKTKISVKLNLVDTGNTLIKATLAGKGPDVALMIPSGTPVELAARGALLPLNECLTEDVLNEFHSSAFTPFYYKDNIYAMPESQIFQVLFYRKDILSQIGIAVPDTWEQFYEAMEKIQNANLVVGVPEIDSTNMGVSASLNIFSSLLMQNGCLNYYNDDLSATNFDSEAAYEAFSSWSKLYTDYGLDRDINFYTRFRNGEIPLAIRNFSEYVQLQQAAPELRGLWSIAPLPGTLQSNGTISRAAQSTLTGCIMLKTAKQHGVTEQAKKLISWWIGSETQISYGRDLEVSIGIAGRYFSANLKAIEQSKWTSDEYRVLSEQLSYIKNQPTVVGNYVIGRDLTSALREVIAGTNRPRRALMLYNNSINEEIQRKRKEFGLDE